MQITEETLSNMLDGRMHHAGLHSVKRIRTRVVGQYCNALTARNLCPLTCEQCKAGLTEAIYGINAATARSPYAVLVYRLRNAAQRIIEQQAEHTMQPTLNPFKERVDVDPLELLSEMLK